MKKTGILILIVFVAIIGGMIVYRHSTIPKEEGIAHLIPTTIKLLSELTRYSSSYALGQKIKPDGLIDLPAGISDSSQSVCYFSLSIGKNNIFVITQKDVSGQIKAWIDINLNRCFSDEKVLSGIARKYSEDRNNTWKYFDFGEIQISGENFTSAPFYFLCDKGGRYIYIQPVGCMEGKIRLGKHTYRVVVVDGDYDGKFSTLYEPSANYRYCGCDTFTADSNRYGLFGRNIYDPGKIVPLGKYFKFTRECYGINMPTDGKNEECYTSIDLSADGKTLRMLPIEPAMGTLKIGNNRRLSTQLLSDSATQGVNFRDEIKLPAGLYQMHWGELTFIDKEDQEHKLRPDFCDDIRKGRFEIIEGQTVT
ncbi:MAG: hypothetical protein FJY07_13175, partial [Bacteroidetes bacterium]|nr:hypothetical protein [Bacteroidota bacterium]